MIMTNLLDISVLFKWIDYCWIFTGILIFLLLEMYRKKEINSIKTLGPKFSTSQPIIFMVICYIIAAIVAAILHSFKLFTYLLSIVILLLYFSVSIIIGNNIFPDRTKKYVVEIKRLFFLYIIFLILLMAENRRLFIKSISDCHPLYALFEVALLIFFTGLYLYILIMGLYIFMGLKSWDRDDRIDKKLLRLEKENEILQTKIDEWVEGRKQENDKRTTIWKIIWFIPFNFLFVVFAFINYFKQMYRNLSILFYTKLGEWIIKREESLDNDKLTKFEANTRQIITIAVLLVVYFWLNFAVGADSVITKIVYGFSTIIIIPIVINRYTSTDR